MTKQKFFRNKRWLPVLMCATLLWTGTPAWGQTILDDPRLTVPVTASIFPETDAVLMIDDISFEVAPDRSHSFEEHDIVKVLTKDGIDENASLVRAVDQSQTTVEVKVARTIKADGRIIDAPPPQYGPLAPDSPIYGSIKRFSLQFPDLEVGDMIEFHLLTKHKPKPGGHFWATTYVQNPMPILDSTFSVTIPEGIYFQTATPGEKRLEPVRTKFTKNGTSYQKLKWEVKEEAAYEFEPLSPKALSLLKRIEVSSFKDWGEVAQFIQKDWEKHNTLDEGLVLRIAGWMPASGDLKERASTLMRELNRNRKIASFLGETPTFHDLRKIFNEQLVSSPDATILASAALSMAGIPNVPIASFGVNVQSLADELPNPEKVAKIILEIPRAGDSSLWFDPETPGFILTSLPDRTSDTAALSWDPRFVAADNGLMDLRVTSAFDNREELAIEGRLERNGKAELTVQFDRYGSSALISRQAARDFQEGGREARDRALSTFFRNTARAYGPRARLLSRFFELDAETVDPFSLSFTVSVPGFGQVQDGTLLVPLPRFLSSSLRAAARERNRTTPLVFDQPYQQDVRIHLVFPEGSQVLEAPATVQKKTAEAEFVATGRASGNEVWYVGRLTVLDPWIEQEALQRSMEILNAALKSEDTILKVDLSKAETPTSPSSGDEEEEES